MTKTITTPMSSTRKIADQTIPATIKTKSSTVPIGIGPFDLMVERLRACGGLAAACRVGVRPG